MHKKLLMACLALVAFAALPSIASARPVLTQPTGTVLGTALPGGTITATNVGSTTMVTPIGTLTCTTAHLEGELKTNSTAAGVEGEITNATFAGTGAQAAGEPDNECTGSNILLPSSSVTPNPATNGLPWCVAAATTADTFTLKGGACGGMQRPINFIIVPTGIGTCEYSRVETVNGSITTHGAGEGENTLRISEVKWTKSAGPSACPSEGKLNMVFTLENATGGIFVSS